MLNKDQINLYSAAYQHEMYITKQGSRWLRWILIEAAIHAAKRAGSLRRFYYKVERKKEGKLAKVATARKLLEWTYHILRDGRTYQEMEKIADLLGRPEGDLIK